MEYDIKLIINKEDGFIPVRNAEKKLENKGVECKYRWLMKVKDGDRLYIIKTNINNKIDIKCLENELKKIKEIKHFDFCMI